MINNKRNTEAAVEPLGPTVDELLSKT